MRSTRSQRKNINGKHKTMIYLSHAAMIEMVHRFKRFLLVSGRTNYAKRAARRRLNSALVELVTARRQEGDSNA